MNDTSLVFVTNNNNTTTSLFASPRSNMSHDDEMTYNENFLLQIQYSIYGICFPIIAIIGVLANTASFIVLTRPIMRSSINVYLAGLSFFDGLLLLFALFLYPPFSYCASDMYQLDSFWCRYFAATTQLTYPMTCVLQSGSVWTLVAITVDRFIAIKWPLRARDILTSQRSQYVLMIIAFWALVYNLPTFFEIGPDDKGFITPTPLRNNENYVLVYKGYCYLFLMFLIPAILMIVLNGFVTQAVRRAYRVRRQLSGREEKERRCTLMAVLVVVTFLVLNLMALINNCIENFSVSTYKTTTYSILVYIGNFLVAIGSASNFIIYCVLGLRFRRMFCKIFCVWFYNPDKDCNIYISAYYGSVRSNVGIGTGGTNAAQSNEHQDLATLMAELNSDTHSIRSAGRHDNRPLLINSPLMSPEIYHRSPQYQRRRLQQQVHQNGFQDKISFTRVNTSEAAANNKPQRTSCPTLSVPTTNLLNT